MNVKLFLHLAHEWLIAFSVVFEWFAHAMKKNKINIEIIKQICELMLYYWTL